MRFRYVSGKLALHAHALLGDQQHSRAQDQDGAEHIEDGGAHAASGGQLGAGVIGNLDCQSLICCDSEFLILIQFVVTSGSRSLNQRVCIQVNALDDDLAGSNGGKAINRNCLITVGDTVFGIGNLD